MAARALATALVLGSVAVVACSSSGDSGDAGPDSFIPGATFDANESCTTTADCQTGLVCAYAVADGCSAMGECIENNCVEDPNCPPVPASPACGCNGADVPYVTSAYTLAPVSSPTGCPGVDATLPDANGEDADAGDSGDASPGDASDARAD